MSWRPAWAKVKRKEEEEKGGRREGREERGVREGRKEGGKAGTHIRLCSL